MNRHLWTPGVKHQDRGTFLVRSRTDRSRQYLVDLAAYGGNGQCDCPDFRCRRQFVLEKTPASQRTEPNRCRHIMLARRFAADCYTAGLLKSESRLDGP